LTQTPSGTDFRVRRVVIRDGINFRNQEIAITL